MLLMLEWARQSDSDETRLATAVADRLCRPENDFGPTTLVAMAVKFAADMLLVRFDDEQDQFDRYVDAAFDATGPTLAAAELVRAARCADNDDLLVLVARTIREYGAIHTVVVAARCLRNVAAFAFPDQPPSLSLERGASWLAGRLFSGDESL